MMDFTIPVTRTSVQTHAVISCVSVTYALNNFRTAIAFNHRDVMLTLQIEPELRTIAKIATEADGRVGSNRTPAVQNIGDAAGRHTNVDREAIGA